MFLGLFLFAKKNVFFLLEAGFIVFPGLLLPFFLMRGHSLVELTEHHNSADDIIVL